MLGTLFLTSLIQASSPAPVAAAPDGWQVAGTETSCVALSGFRSGTVMSLLAMPQQGGIAFLIQNPGWTHLEDGRVYPLRIRFDRGEEWPIPAMARRNIDSDGPGLVFLVSPGEVEGQKFFAEFAAASGMHIMAGNASFERLALTGTRQVTSQLAQCLQRLGTHSGNPFADTDSAATARRI